MNALKLHVYEDADSAANAAATMIAEAARSAAASTGKFTLAVSGGRTPWIMLRALTNEDLPWARLHIFQVDERIAPEEDPDRNFTHLRDSFLNHVPLPPENVHPMPVVSRDLDAAVVEYERTLEAIAGSPPILDLVHLGLGPDGHTASLIPGDPVLGVTDAEVGLTGVYQGRPRMTLTYPVLNRAHRILWVITGADKQPALRRLLDGDESIPAGRIARSQAVVIADRAAAGELSAAGKTA